MAEFEFDGARFTTRKIDPRTQLHILKRLARIAPVVKDVMALAKKAETGDSRDFEAVAGILAPITLAIAEMPDGDFDFVLNHALSAAYQFAGDKWMRVRDPDTGIVKNQDNLDPVRSLWITWHVLQDNFAATFARLPAGGETTP